MSMRNFLSKNNGNRDEGRALIPERSSSSWDVESLEVEPIILDEEAVAIDQAKEKELAMVVSAEWDKAMQEREEAVHKWKALQSQGQDYKLSITIPKSNHAILTTSPTPTRDDPATPYFHKANGSGAAGQKSPSVTVVKNKTMNKSAS